MMTLSISRSSLFNNNQLLFTKTPNAHQSRSFCRFSPQLQHLHKYQQFNSISNNPLRLLVRNEKMRRFGAVCYSAPLTPQILQFVSTVSTAYVVVLGQFSGSSPNASKRDSYPQILSCPVIRTTSTCNHRIMDDYGIWAAFLALFVRLFFFIPGELELPFITLMLVIVSPYQIMRLRGKQEGVIFSLIIAAYLAFQHFTRAGSLKKAFDQGSVIATLAIICVVVVPCLLLI
ncbi:hypothetical protein CASFOL_014407 [Castilleja foliolosa]|uniref:Uncharacterized protein n=1 Tax=Castilleja foliolosa TaxID=1961234 RepID=A0ABD3DQG3_9LAMI